MKFKKYLALLLVLVLMFTLLAACTNTNSSGGDDPGDNPGGGTTQPGDNPGGQPEPPEDNPGSQPGGEEITDTTSVYDLTAVYAHLEALDVAVTDEEKVTSHDGLTVTTVDLSTLTGDYKIEKAGNYVFSGTTTYSIVLGKKDIDIHIWLENATFGSVFADKKPSSTIITLVGTNVLTGAACASDTKDEIKGTLHVKNDLVINGEGTLTIQSSLDDKNGIHCSGTLKIVDATVNVTASKHGIRGNNAVIIVGAKLNVKALGKDGIQTDNEQDYVEGAETEADNTLGYIYIESSEVTINAADDGIVAATYLYIKSGTINITTNGGAPAKVSESSSDSAGGKALKAGSIDLVGSSGTVVKELTGSDYYEWYAIIIEDGTFVLNSNDDAIHSNGIVVIKGGTFTIATGDDGIHADQLTRIEGGDITITKSYEGIEGAKVEINGGKIMLTAVDDGINGADGSDVRTGVASANCYIVIDRAEIHVDASGDGIDSNGTVKINGGTIYVDGPTSNGDTALDSDAGILINGGTVVAVGSSGMVEVPGSNSTQCVLVYAGNTIAANSVLTLKSGDDTIITYTVAKNIQAVIMSSADITTGNTYVLYSGTTQLATFNVTSTVTTYGSVGGGPGGGMGPGGRPGGRF